MLLDHQHPEAVLVGGAVAGISVAAFGGMFVNLGRRIVSGDEKAVVARVPGPVADIREVVGIIQKNPAVIEAYLGGGHD